MQASQSYGTSDQRESEPGQPHQCGPVVRHADRANFTGADVRGAVLRDGITSAQLYSTASYQAHDLTGIGLGNNDLDAA